MISKARRGIGLIRHLSKYLSRHVLDQIYKLHERPHLDYGDIVYHKHDPEARFHKKVRTSPILSSTCCNRSMARDNQS